MTREEHLLTILSEECAEIQQRVSKALRFGLTQVQEDADDKPEENPEHLTNRERIRREVADFLGMLHMLQILDVTFIVESDLRRLAHRKIERVNRYLERSAACGTLEASPLEPAEGSDR